MPVYVWKDVLVDYTPGLVVIRARSVAKALEIAHKRLDWGVEDLDPDKVEELEMNELVYVSGGG